MSVPKKIKNETRQIMNCISNCQDYSEASSRGLNAVFFPAICDSAIKRNIFDESASTTSASESMPEDGLCSKTFFDVVRGDNLTSELARWAVEFNITNSALNSLLAILSKYIHMSTAYKKMLAR